MEKKSAPTPLGEFLKSMREKRGVTLRDVENATGLSNAYLSQLETGKRKTLKLPSPDVLRRLANYFNVSMMEILQHAGYLEESDIEETMEERIDKAYRHAISDPRFKSGTRITKDPSLETKRFIVEMYEEMMEEKLL